jgi:hypothetical protein
MPRYFFNVQDESASTDHEGVELADSDEARIAATMMAGQILQESPASIWRSSDWSMQVCDETGLVLFSLVFVGIDAPAAARRH